MSGFLRRWASHPLVRVGFVVVTLVFGFVAIFSDRENIGQALRELPAGWAVLSAVFLLAGLLAQMYVWRSLLTGLGSSLPVRVSARVYYLGQLGKYVPGAVWPMLAQAEIARDHGVPRARSGAAFALLMLVLPATGGILAVATLPLQTQDLPIWWAVLPGAVGLVCIAHPRVINLGLALVWRVLRAPGPPATLTARTLWVAIGWSVAQWIALGLSVWALAVGLGAESDRTLTLAVGGFAAAFAAGLVVVIAPAGAGVREVVLVASLLPVLDRADAITVAVLSRSATIVADLLLAGVATLVTRRTPRQAVTAEPGRAP